MQIISGIVAREFKSDDRPDLYAGTPPLEALKATVSIAAYHKETFSVMHIDVSRAYFHAKAQRLVLVRLPVEDPMGADTGEIGLLRDWQEHVNNWGYQLGLSSEESVSPGRCTEFQE